MEILDGKKLSNEIIEELKVRCDELKEKGIKPKFAVIMVGNDKASQIYVKNKRKACERIGIECVECFLDENIQQKELIDKGLFREAQQMDIDDVRAKFGNKYNESIQEMLEYTDELLNK